ncbi:hypothetical protein ABW20_dc0104674 [Dactylellina cionopaga]|nr:hypothetical protein ABW20_dc0104674 [Dactylellina cionopaga]
MLQLIDYTLPDPVGGSKDYEWARRKRTKWLASGWENHPPWLISANADNYAMWALAEFQQREFGRYPYKPTMYARPWDYQRGRGSKNSIVSAADWKGETADIEKEVCRRGNLTISTVNYSYKRVPAWRLSPDECFNGAFDMDDAWITMNTTSQ